MAVRGIDMLIYVGADAVAMQKGAKLNRTADTLDISTKDNAGWKTFLAGLREWSIEADGLYTLPTATGNTGVRALEDAFKNGTEVTVKFVLASTTGLVVGDTTGYTGSAVITDFPLEAPMDDGLTFSITLQGTGALTEVLKTI